MATKNGLIKKTALKDFDSTRKTGLLSITLKDDDELIDVRLTDGEDNVVLVTSKGLSITFDEKDVRPVGRSAQGVIGIRLDDKDFVIGMESILLLKMQHYLRLQSMVLEKEQSYLNIEYKTEVEEEL